MFPPLEYVLRFNFHCFLLGPSQAPRISLDQIPNTTVRGNTDTTRPPLPFPSYKKEENDSINEDLKTQKLNALHAIIEDPTSDETKKRITVEETNARVRCWLNSPASYFGPPEEDKSEDKRTQPDSNNTVTSTKAFTVTSNVDSFSLTVIKDKTSLLQNGLVYPSVVRLPGQDNSNVPNHSQGKKEVPKVPVTGTDNKSKDNFVIASSQGDTPVRTLVIVPSSHEGEKTPVDEKRQSSVPIAAINTADVSKGFYSLADIIAKSSNAPVPSISSRNSANEQPQATNSSLTLSGSAGGVLTPGEKHSKLSTVTSGNKNINQKQSTKNLSLNVDPETSRGSSSNQSLVNIAPKTNEISPDNAARLYSSIVKAQALLQQHHNLLLKISTSNSNQPPYASINQVRPILQQQNTSLGTMHTSLPSSSAATPQDILLHHRNMFLRLSVPNNAQMFNAGTSRSLPQNQNVQSSSFTGSTPSNTSTPKSLSSLQQHQNQQLRFSGPNNRDTSRSSSDLIKKEPQPNKDTRPSASFTSLPNSSTSNSFGSFQRPQNMPLRFAGSENRHTSKTNSDTRQKVPQHFENSAFSRPNTSLSNCPAASLETFRQSSKSPLRFPVSSKSSSSITQKQPLKHEKTSISSPDTSASKSGTGTCSSNVKEYTKQHQNGSQATLTLTGNQFTTSSSLNSKVVTIESPKNVTTNVTPKVEEMRPNDAALLYANIIKSQEHLRLLHNLSSKSASSNNTASQMTTERPMPLLTQRVPALRGIPTNLGLRQSMDPRTVERARFSLNPSSQPSVPLFPDQRCQNNLADQMIRHRFVGHQNLFGSQSGGAINLTPLFFNRGKHLIVDYFSVLYLFCIVLLLASCEYGLPLKSQVATT